MNEVRGIDVEQIMRRLRENVRQRGGSEGLPLGDKRASPFDDGQGAVDFAYLAPGHDIRHVSFSSHRFIVGPLVAAIKKVLYKLLTPLLDRQVAYNAANARVTTHLKEWMEALDYQYALVSRQIETLERRHARPESLAAPSGALQGREEDIEERQRIYLQFFKGGENVIDLDLVVVEMADAAFTHLSARPDDSVGGIIAARVIERLSPRRVIELIELCHRKLASGGRLVVEAPNPTVRMVSADRFSEGPSQVPPAHPGTLHFLFEAAGFHEVELRFSGPVDARLFGVQVYAVTGRKDGAHDVR